MTSRRILVLFGFLMFAGVLQAGEKGTQFTVGGFVFTVPQSWDMVEPSSAMRKAELKAIDPKTQALAETVFFCFGPGQGGSAVENITRWKGQMTDLAAEKVEKKEIAGTQVTLVRLEGNYQSGMPGGPKVAVAGTVLLGAILEGPEGNVFVKTTGPAAWVKQLEKDFAALIESGAKNLRG